MIQECIRGVVAGRGLTREQAEEAMREILEGKATPAQIAGLAVALRMKGETVDELTGFASVMRAMAAKVPHSQTALLDTCGTGGDGSGTFNISTTVALVAAGAGAAVAKHGNRAISSRTGSAEVLKALGVRVDLSPEQAGRCLDEIGVAFLFAPVMHAAMKHAAAPRAELGLRTFFNLLGPLSNPAGATRQLVGVFDGDFVEPVAEVLARLGSERAWVVHGLDGLDELSTCDETRVAEVRDGKVRGFYIRASDLGLAEARLEDLKGGDAQDNARATLDVLSGSKGAHRDIVLLNAAAALLVAGKAPSIQAALPLAGHSIDSGAAMAKLDSLKRLSNSLPGGDVRVTNVLKKIAASRKKDVEALKKELPVEKILERLIGAPAGRSFKGALKAAKGLALIAEVKRASPSKGALMGPKQTPAKLAALYAAAGATAVSVVTEPKFFKGSGAMIDEVKKACPLPVLRKDFIVDPWQLYESKLLRADAVLLVAALLPESRDLKRMIAAANNLSLTPLVEVHTAEELKRVLRAEAEYIGVNNRDLGTFKVDLKVTERLIKLVPEDKYVVSESGIFDAAAAEGLWRQGVKGVLVGEALIKAKDTQALAAGIASVGRIG